MGLLTIYLPADFYTYFICNLITNNKILMKNITKIVQKPCYYSMFFFLCLLLLPIGTHAQNVVNSEKITGVVLDEGGEPAIGATIVEKGTNNATVTDVNGKFTLHANPKSKLIVSHIGFADQEVPVSQAGRIILKRISKELSEVVVQ